MYQMNIAEIKVSYFSKNTKQTQIKESEDAYNVLVKAWNKDTLELQEEFKILLLNRHNTVLGIYSVSKGGTTSTVVDPKLVFSVALKCNASSLIFAHNHPSGNLKPSKTDINLTNKLLAAANFLDIVVLDHIIISQNGYYSFSDNGDMEV